jgi:hypothetical protein
MPSAGTGAGRVAALFLQLSTDEFLVVGSGAAQVAFSTDRPGPNHVGLEHVEEEFFENGWKPRRTLNGDETAQGQLLRLSVADLGEGRIYRVRLYRYP